MVTPILPYNGRDEMPKISESLRKGLTKKVEEKTVKLNVNFYLLTNGVQRHAGDR